MNSKTRDRASRSPCAAATTKESNSSPALFIVDKFPRVTGTHPPGSASTWWWNEPRIATPTACNRTARSVPGCGPGQPTADPPSRWSAAPSSRADTMSESAPPVPSHSIVAAQRKGSKPCIAAAQATSTAPAHARSVAPAQLRAAAITRSVLMRCRNESVSAASARANSACRSAPVPSPRIIASSAATHCARSAGRHRSDPPRTESSSALRARNASANPNRPVPSASAANPTSASLRASTASVVLASPVSPIRNTALPSNPRASRCRPIWRSHDALVDSYRDSSAGDVGRNRRSSTRAALYRPWPASATPRHQLCRASVAAGRSVRPGSAPNAASRSAGPMLSDFPVTGDDFETLCTTSGYGHSRTAGTRVGRPRTPDTATHECECRAG